MKVQQFKLWKEPKKGTKVATAATPTRIGIVNKISRPTYGWNKKVEVLFPGKKRPTRKTFAMTSLIDFDAYYAAMQAEMGNLFLAKSAVDDAVQKGALVPDPSKGTKEVAVGESPSGMAPASGAGTIASSNLASPTKG